jgi:hypothetical protein
MTSKCILAVALITPFLTVPSMAQQYQGGPKSSFGPTRQIYSGGDIYAQGVDIYAPVVRPYYPYRAYGVAPRTVVSPGASRLIQ